jgi:hypothetical protein
LGVLRVEGLVPTPKYGKIGGVQAIDNKKG